MMTEAASRVDSGRGREGTVFDIGYRSYTGVREGIGRSRRAPGERITQHGGERQRAERRNRLREKADAAEPDERWKMACGAPQHGGL